MLPETDRIAPLAATFCDFCHEAGQPLTSYPCRRFETQFIRRGAVLLVRQCRCCAAGYRPEPGDRVLVTHVSLDAWGACPTCAALLDAAAIDRLGRRMVERLVGDDVALVHRPLVARQLLATLEAFWRHRLPVN